MEYSPDEAKVIRDGRAVKVHASEVVPGDLISVAVGDKIPADARVVAISSASFTIDQALLTGESQSVSKITETVKDEKAVKQDMVNMLFSVSGFSLSILSPTPKLTRRSLSGNYRRQRKGSGHRHCHWNYHRHR
jgi:P-type Ca2+ transporter type 2A